MYPDPFSPRSCGWVTERKPRPLASLMRCSHLPRSRCRKSRTPKAFQARVRAYHIARVMLSSCSSSTSVAPRMFAVSAIRSVPAFEHIDRPVVPSIIVSVFLHCEGDSVLAWFLALEPRILSGQGHFSCVFGRPDQQQDELTGLGGEKVAGTNRARRHNSPRLSDSTGVFLSNWSRTTGLCASSPHIVER